MKKNHDRLIIIHVTKNKAFHKYYWNLIGIYSPNKLLIEINMFDLIGVGQQAIYRHLKCFKIIKKHNLLNRIYQQK